ncbi:hypothetical protein [Streptomyces aquilus]|uniref:hypothetical protein n=1 Tax=Streptomyces aquilus TaxID=2548456 RepID=UPI0036DAD669
MSLPVDHPAVGKPVVELRDLAHDRWMIDPAMDGERDSVQRMSRATPSNPRVLYGDYHTAAALVPIGEVVTVCQPSRLPRPAPPLRWPYDDSPTTRSAFAYCSPPARRRTPTGCTPRGRRRGRHRRTGSGWNGPPSRPPPLTT